MLNLTAQWNARAKALSWQLALAGCAVMSLLLGATAYAESPPPSVVVNAAPKDLVLSDADLRAGLFRPAVFCPPIPSSPANAVCAAFFGGEASFVAAADASLKVTVALREHGEVVAEEQRFCLGTALILSHTIGDSSVACSRPVAGSPGLTTYTIAYQLANSFGTLELSTRGGPQGGPHPTYNFDLLVLLADRQVAKIRAAAIPASTATPTVVSSPALTTSVTVAARPVALIGTTHETLRDLVPAAGSPNPVAFYDGIPSPRDISPEVAVVATNSGLAALIALLLGLASLLTSAALHELRPPTRLRRLRLHVPLPQWLHVLLIAGGVIAVPVLLNGGIDVNTESGRAVVVGDVLTGGLVATLIVATNLLYHRLRTKKPTRFHVFFPGFVVAALLIVASRAGGLHPGLAYTAFGGVTALAVLGGPDRAIRHLTELWVLFAIGVVLWLLLLTPLGSNPMYTLFALTLFLIVASDLLFRSLPLELTEGLDVWNWRRVPALVNLFVASFVVLSTLVNPNHSFISAVQAQRTVGFLAIVALYLLSAALAYLVALTARRKRLSVAFA